MKKIKFKIYTLGCKVNQYDSGQIHRALVGADFQPVSENADISIINTCSVTKSAIRKNKNIINKSKIQSRVFGTKSKIILIGCWPKTQAIKEKETGVDLILKNKTNSIIARKIIKFIAKEEKQNINLSPIIFNKNKARYFLKVQDGCNQFCSYCIIPYARGSLKSRSAKDIIDEIEQVIKAGYQEIVISGIHLGLYGADLKKKINLSELIKKIILVKDLGRIRLSSIEITEVTDSLLNLIAKNRKICRHLHIPLQSGSNKILKLMHRPYTKEYYLNKIKKIKKLIPDIAISTDIIVGFPGETDKDFKESFNLIKKINFSRLHVFPFSAHEKTEAAGFPGKVDGKIMAERGEMLRSFNKILMNNFRNNYKGKNLQVVIEKETGKKTIGKSEYYFDIEFDIKNKKNLLGKIVDVKI